ncbi:MAG: NTP transferase domain-containing protein [Pseudomonadota bacterium]
MTEATRDVTAEHAETVLSKLLVWQRSAHQTALIILTEIEGGAVRAPGAIMAVSEDGSLAGYMSGGCIDADLVLQAQSTMESGLAKRVRYGAGSPYVDLPLPCGGALVLTILPNPDTNILSDALSALEHRERAALRLSSDFQLSLAPPQPSSATPDGGFIALLHPRPRLRIAGRGADCLALARLAKASGWPVQLLLTDENDLASASAAGLTDVSMLETPGTLPKIEDDDSTAFVMMAHDRDWDVPLLYQAVSGPAFYVGAVGSPRTHAGRREALAEAGLEAAELDRIRGPVGLIPSMRNASMLAVSVLAEIVEAFHLPARQPFAKTGVLVLAAGKSTRFGEDKLMAKLQGEPVLAHTDRTVSNLVFGARVAITDPARPDRAALLQNRGWQTLDNPAPERGQASSLILGVEASTAQPDLEFVLVLLGDMPNVPEAHLKALAAAFVPGTDAVFSTVDGVPCPPVLFSRPALAELDSLSGDAGARKLFQTLPNVRTVPLHPDHALDIDVPDDLERAGGLTHA